MMKRTAAAVLAMAFAAAVHAGDDEHHSHPAPEKLGTVTFPTSCTPGGQASIRPGAGAPAFVCVRRVRTGVSRRRRPRSRLRDRALGDCHVAFPPALGTAGGRGAARRGRASSEGRSKFELARFVSVSSSRPWTRTIVTPNMRHLRFARNGMRVPWPTSHGATHVMPRRRSSTRLPSSRRRHRSTRRTPIRNEPPRFSNQFFASNPSTPEWLTT